MKTFIRAVCLVVVSLVLYRDDVRSAVLFIALMGVIFWAIPEMCMFVVKCDKEENGGENDA